MAWTHSYGTASNRLGLMTAIRDFLVTVGWTVVDDYLALANAPFVALTSPGESGDDPVGLLFEAIPGSTNIAVASFISWDTVATNMWTPGTGNTVSHSNRVFTKSSGAPAFTDLFSVGDTVSIFNSTYADNNVCRCKVSAITSSALTVDILYPYPYTNNSGVSGVIISKGGPYIFAKSYNNQNGNITSWNSSHYYFLHADKDTFICHTRSSTSYYGAYAGKYIPYHNGVIDAITAQITSGTDTSLTVSDGTKFTVGYKYMISNGKYMHMFTPTSIVGNTINFTAGLTGGASGIVYPVGCNIGMDVHPICVTCGFGTNSNDAVGVPGSSDALYANGAQGAGGWSGNYQRCQYYLLQQAHHNTFLSNLSPDVVTSKYAYIPRYILSPNTKYVKGTVRNIYGMYAQPGNSEDTIRLDSSSGDVYKIFYETNCNDYPWNVVKE